jgi:hypothetical protein
MHERRNSAHVGVVMGYPPDKGIVGADDIATCKIAPQTVFF